MTDNYQKWNQEWQKRIADMGEEALVEKIPELIREGDYLTTCFFDRRIGVAPENGNILVLDGGEDLSTTARLSIYTYLWYCRKDAVKSGNYVPFAALKDAGVFGPAFQKGVLEALAQTFSGHGRELETACLTLGGKKLKTGDVGYELLVLPGLSMQVLFWEGDEEFPAGANLLFDENTPQFIHVESVVTLASEGLGILARRAGLPVKGAAFLIK